MGTIGEFSWQNYGDGSTLRKARLDRCYISQEILNRFDYMQLVRYATLLQYWIVTTFLKPLKESQNFKKIIGFTQIPSS